MKKLIFTGTILAFSLFITSPTHAQAATIPFLQTLHIGMTGHAVTDLQQFLFDLGYSKTAPTGTFSTQTRAAVIAFQKDQDISPTGFFGPITMANANARAELIAEKTIPSTVAIQSISSVNNTASVIGAVMKTITWESTTYPANIGININLIRKTSDTPISYSFVKNIAHNIQNTGTYEWTPSIEDTGNDLFVEVTCSEAASALPQACQIATPPISL